MKERTEMDEWCGECSDAYATEVIIEDGKIIGWYCTPCADKEMADD